MYPNQWRMTDPGTMHGVQSCYLHVARPWRTGHMVYHGPRESVLDFFEPLGFRCPERKGIADFLQEVWPWLAVHTPL